MPIYELLKPFRLRVRKYLKKRMIPMTVDEAEAKREFFAKLYFISAFSLFTLATIQVYKTSMNPDKSKHELAESTVENLKIEGKVRILTFEGFKKTKDYYYERKNNTDENPESALLVESSPSEESKVLSP